MAMERGGTEKGEKRWTERAYPVTIRTDNNGEISGVNRRKSEIRPPYSMPNSSHEKEKNSKGERNLIGNQ